MSTKKEWMQGPIAWMATNPVAANLLMILLLVGGIAVSTQVQREVFPYFDTTEVTISVTVDGATPEEMEKSVALAIEEAMEGIDGIDEVTATMRSGGATIVVEGIDSVDGNVLLQDVKAAVDRITTFPEDAEEPVIALRSARRQVVSLMLTGGETPQALRYWAEVIREELAQDAAIPQAELQGVRDHEVLVEISQDTLRRYGLTIADVSAAIGSTAIEQGGGTLRASSGDIMLRVNERRDYAADFGSIAIRTNDDGSRLILEDIAKITNTFDDSTRWTEFNGQDALAIYVYSYGDKGPEQVAAAALKHVEYFNATMPTDLKLYVRDNQADVFVERQELLMSNAALGMALVFLCLAIFLRPSLAFWVSLGIPVSVLGSFWFFGPLNMTINMMSLFAFLVTLGIVVDDAIVVGENVSAWQERGASPLKAAICGTREVGIPVVFSVLTNMLAFMPILFIPGVMGKIWLSIPLVVFSVFFLSLVESLFILPAHLAHSRQINPEDSEQIWQERSTWGKIVAWPSRFQRQINAGILYLIQNNFSNFVKKVLHLRYITIAVAIAILTATAAYVASGRMGFDLMPRVESDYAYAEAELPEGTPHAEIQKIKNHILYCAEEVVAANGGDALSTGISAMIVDEALYIYVYLTDPDVRPMNTTDFMEEWRTKVGVMAGVEKLLFQSDRGGPGSGSSLTLYLSHRDTDTLDQAAIAFGELISTYAGIGDIDTGTSRTARQFDVKLTPAAEQLGFTSQSVSTQIRNAFQGTIALRQQRGNNEITVRVRLPEEERRNEAAFEDLVLRAPSGQEVLLRDIIILEDGKADSVIRHVDGRRTATVSANVTPSSETGRMMEVLSAEIMPQLMADYSGLSWQFAGRQTEMQESSQTMMYGFLFALVGIYALLAIPFKSYSQPLIIMISIPFGIVGAVFGHWIMDYSLSLVSVYGIVALSGVVVNDSLVLIDFANRQRLQGIASFEAIQQAAVQRCRPILLTTITTFVGLAPLVFETSRQAKMLIPMALSLAFGILFATFICLLLVPTLYLALDDIHELLAKKETK
ncbi:MAG: efflux RND transporter permease subunit [Pseudomonadota bacterium]